MTLKVQLAFNPAASTALYVITVVPTGKKESAGKPVLLTAGGFALSVATGSLKEVGKRMGSSFGVYNVRLAGQVELKVGGS